MRKQEKQVLENAFETINSVIEYELRDGEAFTFVKMYLRTSLQDLYGYVNTSYRFNKFRESEFDEALNMISNFRKLMEEKINQKAVYEKNEM